jgi:hypothetical protein
LESDAVLDIAVEDDGKAKRDTNFGDQVFCS